METAAQRAQWHGIARTIERTTGLELIRSNEQFGVSVAYSSAFPADNLFLPPIICSTVSEHVFLTCHDCPISWNRVWPGPVFVRRCFDTVCSPRAGAVCSPRASAARKGGNYASFDASCRCYPAACRGGFCSPSKRSGPIAFTRSLRAGAEHLGPKA